MPCLERASPALKEILLRLYRSEKLMEIDHHICEFGSVNYHIQSSASKPCDVYLSISIPSLSQGVILSDGLSPYTREVVKDTCSDVADFVEPAKEGYQLTLRLDLNKIPKGKDSVKTITKISMVQAVILISQLKEMLRQISSQEISEGMYRPIKIVYHPREPFFVIGQSQRIITVFPMRFKDKIDVLIATEFFQELMDVGRKEEWAKAPGCCWSPIPPPELRGETIEDLSTNGGFVSFYITSRHIKGKRLEKIVWNLLNFDGYVKYHVKCTRGFIHRRMRKRMLSLVEALQNPNLEVDAKVKKAQGCKYMQKLVSLSKSKIVKRKCSLPTKIKRRMRCSIKIHGVGRLKRQWQKISKFPSAMKYTKLE